MLGYLFAVVVTIGVVASVALWARRIERRIEPPADGAHRSKRFFFPFGGEPPGMDG